MNNERIEALFQRCIKDGFSTEEAVQQIVIVGVTKKEYSSWISEYHNDGQVEN
jgi:hypothetical protein